MEWSEHSRLALFKYLLKLRWIQINNQFITFIWQFKPVLGATFNIPLLMQIPSTH